MANTNFTVHNGLTVGPTTIDAATGNINSSGNITTTGSVFLGTSLNYTPLYARLQHGDNINNYVQLVVQNQNNGNQATTDIVAVANNGNDNDTFIDFGINSSGYNQAAYNLTGPNDGYLYVAGNTSTGGGNLVISTYTLKDIVFSLAGSATGNEIARFRANTNSFVVSSSTTSTSTSTGALIVNGGAGISGTVTAANVSSVSGTNVGYLTADSNYVHIGAASATQLNFKVAGQTPAFIGANGSVVVTGNTSLQSNGYGNIYVQTATGGVSGYVIADTSNVHVGSYTNTQVNFKQNNTTAAFIDTSGNFNIVNALKVAGNTTFVNTQTITTTDTIAAPAINAGTIGNSGASFTGASLTVTGTTNLQGTTNGATINATTLQGGTIGNSGAVLYGTLNSSSASQTNITAVGTLGSLTVSGTTNLQGTTNGATINATTLQGGTIGNSGAVLYGTLNSASAAQTNITSVGTLSGLTVSGAIVPSSNASINIGGTGSQYFNNVYAVNFLGTSTTAKYADLAERYTSDAEYESGTVVDFGGDAEVTLSNIDGSQYVAGVVSTNPAYMMNSDADGLYIALTGRVPTKVTGPVRKGQMMVSNGDGTARSENNPKMGSVIGKALENFGDGVGVIEVVVGRL